MSARRGQFLKRILLTSLEFRMAIPILAQRRHSIAPLERHDLTYHGVQHIFPGNILSTQDCRGELFSLHVDIKNNFRSNLLEKSSLLIYNFSLQYMGLADSAVLLSFGALGKAIHYRPPSK